MLQAVRSVRQAAFAEAWLRARAAPQDLVLVLYGDAAFGDALGARGDLCGNHPVS